MTTGHRLRATALMATLAIAGCSSDGTDTGSSAPLGTGPIASDDSAPATADPTAGTAGGSSTEASTTIPDSGAPSTSGAAEPTTTAAATTTTPTVLPTSATPPDPATISISEFASVDAAVALAYRNGDRALFVVSQSGYIVAIRDGVLDDTRLLDISDAIESGGEQGLLGLAFSLDGSLGYVNYTNGDGNTEIVEYAVGADGTFDPASKRLLLEVDQPASNHNGGQVRVGLDGYVYIGMGDGGSADDPDRRALDVGDLLGKMLRIDPTASGGSPYSIPPDNPFVGVDGARPEIWSVGLRNPWRFSFDLATNDLWIADVGQGEWEEIDVAWADEGGGRGANFGWSAFEGTHRFNEDQPEDGVVPPIYEYEHGDAGCSVSGGIRYRGSAVASLAGYYVYGDYCSGEVRALEIRDDRTAGTEVVLASLAGISEVAQGPDGELFVLSVDDGTVYTVQPSG